MENNGSKGLSRATSDGHRGSPVLKRFFVDDDIIIIRFYLRTSSFLNKKSARCEYMRGRVCVENMFNVNK